jgi:hypothetical protein
MACTADITSKIATVNSFADWKKTSDAAVDRATSSTIDAERVNVFSMAGCLESSINSLSTISTDDAKIQQDIAYINEEIKAEEENVNTAQQRLVLMKGPAISHYASWFPMGRPLRPMSKPVLIGISIFIMLMSFSYLFRTMTAGDLLSRLNAIPAIAAILGQFTPAFWLVLVTLAGVIIYFTWPKK